MSFQDNKLISYLKGARDELKKVIWPSKKETIKHTLMVIGVSLAVAIFLGAIDFIFSQGLDRLLRK